MKDRTRKIFKEVALYSAGFLFLIIFSLVSRVNPILVFLLFFMLAYIKMTEFRKSRKTSILYLGFLFTLGFAFILFAKRYTNLSPYYIPISAISMLCVVLFSSLELALLLSVSLSLFLGFVFNNDLYAASIMFMGCLAGVFFVYKVRQRYKVLQAGVWVSLTMIILLFIVSYRQHIGIVSLYSFNILPAFINGILSAFIVTGSLPVFEFIFNVVTNVSLLELSDFNHPLLKRMVLEAPGTYHHSLLVGNLAEVAAEAVNANALLARVGAYYHDVGKLEKPEYFLENQGKTSSRHEQLKASISKLVIVNHVKDGVALAKKHKINSAIIDFIEQHHGTSLVFYFYIRALEETKKKDEVKEDVFRYVGPKPQTKETAIVLLADSVEAACRALESPDAQRIEEAVHTVINNKFIDGQLDECDLTLKDLNKIAKTFIHILSAIYHSRIGYPEIKSENNAKEPAKKNQDKPSQDKKNSL
ncbi:MAG: HDIG domain-containing protein [Candidatus Omnitrophica bacterium]|nr:HDIG domain-containing protein [Candidatus Omnitrophota bacterium]